MNEVKYSVIIGITKNIFDVDRIKQIVDTINHSFQFANISNYEIIFSYMYRKDEDIRLIEEQINFDNSFAVYISFPKNEIYSKSIQYNNGIINSLGKYIISADLDICWRKDVIKNVNEFFNENENIMIGSSFYYLKEGYYNFNDIVNGTVSDENITAYLKDAERHAYFYGNFQAFSRENIFYIRGYDERMRVWGEDDNDLFFRLRKICQLKCLPDKSNFHLHHLPRVIEGKFDFDTQLKLNQSYRDEDSIIRNCEYWGKEIGKGWNY